MAVKKKFPEETIDSMLRRFKKEVVRSEIQQELRKREYYMPPSEKRRAKQNEAERRAKKNADKLKQHQQY